MTTITPTRHEKLEWARCAQAAYRQSKNDVGHTLSAMAALPENTPLRVHQYDCLQAIYRSWLLNGQIV